MKKIEPKKKGIVYVNTKFLGIGISTIAVIAIVFAAKYFSEKQQGYATSTNFQVWTVQK